jgi:hypothetical protein
MTNLVDVKSSVKFMAIFFISFIHMCIQCLGHFSPLPPTASLSPVPSLSPPTPSLPGRNYFALTSNFVEFMAISNRNSYSNSKIAAQILKTQGEHHTTSQVLRAFLQAKNVDGHCC